MTTYSADAAIRAPRRHARQGAGVGLAEGGITLGDAFVFVVPILLAVEFSVGGRLFLSEVALLLAVPFLFDAARRRGVSRISHAAIALGVLWLFSLVVTDIYRETPFEDYSRGWAKVAFLLVNFAALSLLIDGRWRRVTLFAAGLVLGEALQFYFNPHPYAAADPWKFGLGASVTLAGVLLASRPTIYRQPIVATGILMALGVVNLKLGLRSLGGVCFLAAVLVLLAGRSGQLMRLDRRAFRTFAVVVLSLLAGFIVVEAYGYVARNGLLGEGAQEKYQAQQTSFGTLLSGRPEIIASTHAIRDSPIIGHGSWAKDSVYVKSLGGELKKAGFRGPINLSSGLIPSHSHVFSAWVEAGILGAVFWLWALAFAASVLPRLHWLADGRVAFTAVVGTWFLWDVFFSPFGAEARLVMPFYLIVLLLARRDISAASSGRERK